MPSYQLFASKQSALSAAAKAVAETRPDWDVSTSHEHCISTGAVDSCHRRTAADMARWAAQDAKWGLPPQIVPGRPIMGVVVTGTGPFQRDGSNPRDMATCVHGYAWMEG